MTDSGLWIRVLVGVLATYSSGFSFAFVTLQAGSSLHAVLMKARVVKIPGASGLCIAPFKKKCLVVIQICPHFLLFLWSLHEKFEKRKTWNRGAYFAVNIFLLSLGLSPSVPAPQYSLQSLSWMGHFLRQNPDSILSFFFKILSVIVRSYH